MIGFNINLNKATNQTPVSIEVSASYEKHILEHIRKIVPVSDQQLDRVREQYSADGFTMVRFNLPDVSNDQLSQIAWHIGEWYSRMAILLNPNLN